MAKSNAKNAPKAQQQQQQKSPEKEPTGISSNQWVASVDRRLRKFNKKLDNCDSLRKKNQADLNPDQIRLMKEEDMIKQIVEELKQLRANIEEIPVPEPAPELPPFDTTIYNKFMYLHSNGILLDPAFQPWMDDMNVAPNKLEELRLFCYALVEPSVNSEARCDSFTNHVCKVAAQEKSQPKVEGVHLTYAEISSIASKVYYEVERREKDAAMRGLPYPRPSEHYLPKKMEQPTYEEPARDDWSAAPVSNMAQQPPKDMGKSKTENKGYGGDKSNGKGNKPQGGGSGFKGGNKGGKGKGKGVSRRD